ncbi:MAG: putative Ig domain-containing protein, partial [Microcystis panniformis]
RVYLSSDPSLDGSDRNLGEFWRGSKLAAGDSYQGSLNVTLPDGIEGTFYILVFSDSNISNARPVPYQYEYDWRSGIDFSYSPYRELARVPEFRDEGNNITAVPLPINLAVPPDLQVTTINIPERVITGQSFNVTYTVSNKGEGDTPIRQSNWTDLIYLSRDPFLDLQSDRYLGYEDHTGGLQAGNSYSITKTFRAPSDLTGPFYVFVVTDSPRDNIRGKVFEGNQEGNNATPSSQPLILQLPPPSDLQVENITLPSLAQSGEPITIEWTVNNKGEYKAEGEWTDAVYLSADETWDINDTLIGRSTFKGLLNSNQSYTFKLQSILPPAPLGQYRIIVRPDIFNQVYEGTNEANNRTTSPGTLTVTVPELQLGVPLQTTLNTGQERLFRVNVGLGQTLQVNLTSTATEAANELFVRFDNAPTGIVYDASYSGQLIPNQEAVIPTTKPGTYYVLVRGQSEPQNNTPVTLLADTIPFSITDIETDRGGDSRYVTTTIKGAQFNPKAIVKLVRPGFAEYEPVRYEVLDSTEIRAIFDLTSAFHGLYDVKVINPDGQQAIVPYRYLVERAIEPDIDIGLGGPRVLAPGDKGTYGVSVKSLTNIDTPYIHFQFGVPELGKNGIVFNFPYLNFYSNLRGQPENQNLEDVPWASLISDINTSGQNLAPGYVLDLPTGGFIDQTFNAQTYPGLSALLAQDFLGLRLALEEQYPNLKGQIEKPEDLDKAVPGLYQTYRNIKDYNPLSDVDPFDVAFQFSILASATALTRQEFIDQQTAEALKLRNAILKDATASSGLIILAANADTWVKAYLAALETSGLLRPENQAPPVREDPLVISLMATLATGILAGPEGDRLTTNGDLVSFFEQVRRWYGHNPTKIGQQLPPNPQDYDLGLTQDTHFEAFNIYVPFSTARLDLPPFVAVPPPSFSGFLNTPGTVSQQAILLGPVSDSKQNFLPQNQPLPYTIQFENAATASSKVGEIRIVTQLDRDLDPRTFQLGDLKIGDIQVNIPNGRGSFDGDFDFIRSKGFILRVSGGLDPLSNTATWLLQAIDPDTGELVQNPNLGLLSPNNASGIGQGFVAYTVQPKTDVNTRTEITSQARVIFNTAAPFDTQTLSYLLDAQAPTTTVTVQPLSQGSSDYQVTWKAIDDNNGSGIKHITVYVAKDGGNFEIWQRQTTETSAIYQGETGHNYEFIALATDNAGNREQPRLGIQPPDDGSSVNLGTLPNFDRTSTPDLGKPPSPTPQPSTNPLFTEAEKLIPSVVPTSRQSEFESILQPFTSQAFVTGIRQSHGNIGSMAIAVKPDGSALISGGSGRNEIYLIPPEGLAGKTNLTPLQILPYPIFDLAFDPQGNLWATTGGNGLLKLNAETGAIVKNYGESITQTLAIDAATGTIYVSSANGVEIFDPTKESFSHFSDIRVGNLAFDNQGNLWGATWPDRGDIIRFDKRGKAQKMLEFNTPVDSLSFGKAGTKLEGLLFISNNSGVKPNTDSQLIMVDVATLRQVSLAKGGSRGDIIKTTADGRILLSQSHQIDVISPLVAPRVAYTNPAPNANLTLPENTITVVFDQDMLVGTATDAASILNPANYQLAGQTVGNLTPLSVIYDPATRSALLNFETLIPDKYELRVENSLRSKAGLAMPEDYISKFTAISDFLPFVNFQFNTPRSDRANQTVSYDVTITSKGDSDLLLPLVLLLDPSRQFTGQPLGATGKNEEGAYLIDLSDSLPNGRLKPGQSITGKVITVKNPDNLRVDFTPGLYALPYPNLAPNFTSSPVINGTAGQPYSYQVKAQDPDGVALAYLLYDGPQGMTLNATTGVINWTPIATSAVETPVTLRVYDSRGGYGTQSFKIKVEGGNHKPILQPLPTQIEGQEGESLQIGIAAIDEDNNPLIFWADNLPGGAVFDGTKGLLTWTPNYEAAGTYENVTFFASDGSEIVSQSTQIRIAPTNQAPILIRPSDRIVREGDKVRLQLTANDPEKAELKYSSNLLPGGAKLDPKTGLFEWTPAYFQAGEFEIPFSVSDGEKTTKQNVKITVLNANAVPVFDEMGTWQIKEGQLLYIQAFAFDPDNPSFALPFRLPDGSLTPLEGSEASVTYTVSNLPNGGTFDTDTATLKWTPNFTSAGNYTITVTATDDGNGTGNKASASINIPIRVENTNRIPEITPIGNKTMQRGEVLEIPIQVTDPDGNPIVITAQGLPGFGIPSFATFTDNKDGTGLLRFAPSIADDSGDYTISLKVSDDGDGGKSAVQSQEYTFIVSVAAQNDPPRLSRISDKVAVVGTPLQFEIEANDKNQDSLSFSAIGLPTGATLTSSNIYGKAVFSWTPTASSLGSYPITIKVTDSGNGDSNKILSDQKAFNLVVRNSNQNPVLAPITSQNIDEGKPLQLTVSASDSEGDSLTYTATNLPQGAILDPVTGSLTWTPKYADAGTYKDIAITATDGNKSSTQLLTIQVNNVNQKPVLIPVPIQAGREKSAIQFFLSGNDADGDSLSYSAVTKLPDGAFFDTRTQQFRWTPGYEQAGEYKVRFAVFDPQGASDTIDVTLKVDNVNRSPSLKVSNHNAVLGKELKFNLIGSDPDLNTTLTYSVTDLPEGATFNPTTGEFRWLPNPGQVGDYPLTFGVSDGESSVTERVLIHGAIAPEPLPVTIELTPSFPAIPGQKVLIHAIATSLADIATINLSVNGQPLTLDSQGRGEFTPATPGQYLVTAKATDVDGFAGQTTSIIKVRHPQDNLPPVVAFLNNLEGEKITNITSIVGTVADLNLDEWSLELASLGSNDYVKLAGGNQAIATAPLTQLDPTTLSNGFYQLKLNATDISGRTSLTTAIIEINTSQKSSQYQRSETDLTVTLDGVNLDLIRAYDSLNSSQSATFGQGWRLTNTDTQIQTNVPSSGRENLGVYNPFRVGTRLYLTLPNGERVGFTFQPQRQEIPGLVYYTPAWVADTGVNYTLQSQNALLSLAGERLYELKTGQPYNLSSHALAGKMPAPPAYILTAPDGTIYHLDATGKVQAQITPNGVKLTYSDSGIISPSGESVSFIEDAEGRLSQISAPDGRIVTYKYDAQGNLINARNLALAQSNYYSYAADHRLTLVAAANQPGATISYNIPQPQVITLTGNLGSAFQFNPTVTQGQFQTGESQHYSFSVRQSEVNSTATGIVLLGVEVKGNNIEPNLPLIQGLTPLSSQINGNSAFSLFAVDQEGLNLLEVQGKTGNYSLQMFVAGDVNQDGLVDGVDGQLLTAGLGRKVGEAGYSLNLDVNRDGTINATDVQILGSNFGFKANQAPVVKTTSLLTHEDLQVTVPLINLAEDLEGDEVFYRVLNPVNGTVGMTPNGKGAIFTPNADYTGTASFDLIADDGFSSSQPVKVTVNVSDAPLINLDIQNRNPILEKSEKTQLVFIGDFADQEDVILPANYLTLAS